MDLDGQTRRVKFMIRDRGSNFAAAFDAGLAVAGIRTVLCNVQTPRMNAIAERWIGGCRRELLDRTLAWNQAHLRRILREYETHHNQHRPHRSLNAAAPLKPLPEPIALAHYRVRRHARIGGLSTNIAWSLDVDKVFGTHRMGVDPGELWPVPFGVVQQPQGDRVASGLRDCGHGLSLCRAGPCCPL